MKLLTVSRRYYKFETDVEYNENGIETKDGEIWFPKSSWFKNEDILKFNSVSECEQYFEENIMGKVNSNKYEKTFLGIQTKALKTSESDWEIIKKMMPNPDIVKNPEDDIRIFEAHLANNFIDRDRERFRKDVLKSFAETIPGKNKLMAHDWSHPGNGKFFKAKVEKMTVDEAIEFVGGHPDKNFKKQLEDIAERDGSIYWLVASYYMPNMTEAQKETVMNVDLGMWSAMSIGFRAPNIEDIVDPNNTDKVLFYEYQNTKDRQAEALEGSHVGVPAQYGAQTSKDFQGDKWVDEIDNDLNENIKTYIKNIDKRLEKIKNIEFKAEWTNNYINNLEDNCFAVIEPNTEKDDSGRTIPRAARHLPHHAKGNGAIGTDGKIDLPHLRNALARVNEINPITKNISVSELRKKAQSHLIAQAEKLEIGKNQRSNSTMNFKVEELKVNLTVSEDSVEKDLQTVQETISGEVEKMISVHDETVSEKDEEIAQLKISVDEAVNEMNKHKDAKKEVDEKLKSYTDIFGEASTEDLKELLETAKAYKTANVDATLKLCRFMGITTDEEVETKRKELEAMKLTELLRMKKFLNDSFKKSNGDKNLEDDIVPDTADDFSVDKPDDKPEKKLDSTNVRPNDYKQDD